MALSKRITLYRVEPGKGSQPDTVIPLREIWADVTVPSVSIQFKALAADHTADLQAVIWREDFCGGATRAEVDGTVYRITSAAPLQNSSLKTRLILSREG